MRRWVEEEPPDGGFTDYYYGGCSAVGQTHRYWDQTLLVNGHRVVRENLDTTTIHQSNFSPYSWTGIINTSFSSETTHSSSNVPGAAAHPQDFSAMQVQNYANDAWVGALR